MRISGLLLGLFLIVCSITVKGQVSDEPKQPRILILLDGSSSMLQPWGQDTRFKTAGRIITTLIDSLYKVNDQVEFALRVYGHQHPAQENNCIDTKKEVMFSKDNLTQMSLRLESLHPIGVSPIAYSLKEAAENDLTDEMRYTYSLILITDGGESCGGNICDVVKTLLDKKISFKPYIVSLVDYAPLKDQYNCLGNYLLTTKEKDINTTVGTIVEAYRPMLKMAVIDKKIIKAAVVNAPSVLKVDIPKFEIKKEDTREEPPPPPPPALPKPKIEKAPQAIPKEIPPAPTKDLTDRTITPPPPRPKEDVMFMVVRQLPLLFRGNIMSFYANKVSVPAYTVKRAIPEPVVTPPPVVPPKPVVKPEVKPIPPATVTAETTRPKEPKYNIEREEQKETTLEVFFTDGRGKFYQTTPQVVLLDPRTNQPVQRFYRTVNASGNPDPKTLPTGVYNLTVTGKSNLLIRNVEIRANNKNKIVVQVGKASLRFEYEDSPSQPVSEFSAKVKKNFEPGPVITQLCTQELEYDPGNYHIEISTQPRDHRSVDLDFDALVVIRIERPGFVNITNTNNMGEVKLYYQLGDQYVQFYKMNVNGNVNMQRLKLQRGNYRIGYNRTPNVPYAEETIKQFNVKSNQDTNVELD